MESQKVPLIVRGSVIDPCDADHGGRRGSYAFSTPDLRSHVDNLVLTRASALDDLRMLSFDDILDYLEAVGPSNNICGVTCAGAFPCGRIF